MARRAAIYGCASTTLSEAERAFFRDAAPWGFILFGRNIESPAQVRRLTDEMRDLTGEAALPILIDQEGGRVQRLKPPLWPARPPARVFGEIHARDPEAAIAAARTNSRLIGAELADLGITVDCLPVLDLPAPDADPIIGDRAYGLEPGPVIALARAAADGLLDAGVLPVIKHMPGHGRARADSHVSLPAIETPLEELARHDFVPFRALTDIPLAMTAHVRLDAVDPSRPATLSRKAMGEIVRGRGPQGIGYDGLVMTDDLSMGALTGPFEDRVTAAVGAGCDLMLHCNGDMGEMEAIASVVPLMAGDAARRDASVQALLRRPRQEPVAVAAETEVLAALIGGLWSAA